MISENSLFIYSSGAKPTRIRKSLFSTTLFERLVFS